MLHCFSRLHDKYSSNVEPKGTDDRRRICSLRRLPVFLMIYCAPAVGTSPLLPNLGFHPLNAPTPSTWLSSIVFGTQQVKPRREASIRFSESHVRRAAGDVVNAHAGDPDDTLATRLIKRLSDVLRHRQHIAPSEQRSTFRPSMARRTSSVFSALPCMILCFGLCPCQHNGTYTRNVYPATPTKKPAQILRFAEGKKEPLSRKILGKAA